MQCEEVRQQFADCVAGETGEPVSPMIEQHLAACEDCRGQAEELKMLWTALGSIPASEPSPELPARFRIMLEAYKHGLDQAGEKTWRKRMSRWLSAWWPRHPALQLGFSLGLLLLGLIVGRQLQSVSTGSGSPPNSEVAALRDELSQMRQMVALSLMQQQSASDRLKGVNWSNELKQPGGEVLAALLETLMRDPNVNVRLATVEALRQFGDQQAVRRGVIQAMGRDESPMVQIALIDLAVDLGEKESIETMRQLISGQNVTSSVRDRAERGIAELE